MPNTNIETAVMDESDVEKNLARIIETQKNIIARALCQLKLGNSHKAAEELEKAEL